MTRLAAVCLTAVACLATATFTTPSTAADAENAATQRALSAGWKKLSTAPVDSLAQITTARTGDGVLHAVYAVERVSNSNAYEHNRVSATATSTGTNDLFGDWSGLAGDPDLMVRPDGGLRLTFAGLNDVPGAIGDGYMLEAVSDSTGASWAIPGHVLTQNNSAYAAYGTAGTQLADGTPVSAAALNSGISYRVGTIESSDPIVISTAAPDASLLMPTSCCTYETTLVNAGGNIWAGWYQNGTGEETGLFVQQIYPVLGARMKVPGSSASYGGVGSTNGDQTTAMVARADGSVVVAYGVGYPNTKYVALWQVGATTTSRVPNSAEAQRVALSLSPSGRLYLAWNKDGTQDTYSARTAPNSLVAGEPANLGAPTSSASTRADWIDASGTPAIAFVNDSASEAVYAKVVVTGMSVKVSPSKLRSGRLTKLKIKVTDAGVPLAGATVQVRVPGDKGSCKTNAAGTCSVKLRPRRVGSGRVTVRKAGFMTSTTSLRSVR